jgi:YggT family protein
MMFGSISPYRPWVRTLRRVTSPMLEPFRRLAPPHKLRGLDVSPLLAILAIQILQGLLTQIGRNF